ncbi:MAG: hypothetical protein V3V22_03170 [Methylococcales bacterium]
MKIYITLALCWLLVSAFNSHKILPPQLWEQQADQLLAPLNLINANQQPEIHPSVVMSNAYSFGSNNVLLIIGSGA